MVTWPDLLSEMPGECMAAGTIVALIEKNWTGAPDILQKT
jgi:hypothetical protein